VRVLIATASNAHAGAVSGSSKLNLHEFIGVFDALAKSALMAKPTSGAVQSRV